MTGSSSSAASGDRAAVPAGAPRTIGRCAAGPGLRLIVIAGMHGNEPAGVSAIRRVIDRVRADDLLLRGDIVALRGNVRALLENSRYLEEDLNRLWEEERVAALREGRVVVTGAERSEQAALLEALDALIDEATAGVVIVDLHSTSAPGAPFACISDTLRSRAVALALPVPLVLGVEEAIQGTLLEHFENEGRPMVLLEGGRHEDHETVDNLESALWLILHAVGMIATDGACDVGAHRRRLRDAARGLPPVVEVTHRRHVPEGSPFRMRPGLAHFDRVRKGQILGDDENGSVAAPADGLLLMPRYQARGTDGFFIGRAVRRSWLGASRWARAARLDRLLPRLPGVSRDPSRPQRLLVDPAVARWFTIQLFHLSGFRRLPDRGDHYVFTRRIEP